MTEDTTATPILTPAEYVRSFAAGWAARDAAAIGKLCAADAEMLTLTGAWCEGRTQIEEALQSEFAGLFAKSRLVTGKAKLRMLARSACVIHQRYVISSLLDEEGRAVLVWKLSNAWPTKIRGTDLKSSANAVAIETVVLAHEGLEIEGR